jgi:hypothetical protein
MFYFFFESRDNNKNAPVVIWLTGGPGCSSEIALFYENGPFTIANDLSLKWNDYGWDKVITFNSYEIYFVLIVCHNFIIVLNCSCSRTYSYTVNFYMAAIIVVDCNSKL